MLPITLKIAFFVLARAGSASCFVQVLCVVLEQLQLCMCAILAAWEPMQDGGEEMGGGG